MSAARVNGIVIATDDETLPTADLRQRACTELLRQAVFAQRVASPDLAVEMADPPEGLTFTCDDRMVGQALTNVVKNGVEAIEGAARTGKIGDGKIFVYDLEQVVRIRTGETGNEAL